MLNGPPALAAGGSGEAAVPRSADWFVSPVSPFAAASLLGIPPLDPSLNSAGLGAEKLEIGELEPGLTGTGAPDPGESENCVA
ncbi:MAG: hypothetical protein ACK53V_23920 [Planctomycetota bacterium]